MKLSSLSQYNRGFSDSSQLFQERHFFISTYWCLSINVYLLPRPQFRLCFFHNLTSSYNFLQTRSSSLEYHDKCPSYSCNWNVWKLQITPALQIENIFRNQSWTENIKALWQTLYLSVVEIFCPINFTIIWSNTYFDLDIIEMFSGLQWTGTIYTSRVWAFFISSIFPTLKCSLEIF